MKITKQLNVIAHEGAARQTTTPAGRSKTRQTCRFISICKGFILFFCLWSIGFGLVFPQDSLPKNKKEYLWVNLGLGAGNPIRFDTSVSMPVLVSISYQRKNSIISVRSILCGTFMEEGTISDRAFLYGRVIKSPSHFMTLGIGISIVHYTVRRDSTTIGIPIELQLFQKKTSHFGFYGYADLNSKKSIYGICFCLRIGRLRK